MSIKDPLFLMLKRRIRIQLLDQIVKKEIKVEMLKRHALDVVATEIQVLAKGVARLVKHNKEVHYLHYNKIMEKL
jgi:hypothetical protein